MQDKILTCRDCAANFTFSTNQQQLYVSKGYTNQPRSCPNCRLAHDSRLGLRTGVFRKSGLRSPHHKLRLIPPEAVASTSESS